MQEPKKTGLNFDTIIPHLSKEFKISVAMNEVEPSDIFELTSIANQHLKRLIKKEVTKEFADVILVEKESKSLLSRIISKFN